MHRTSPWHGDASKFLGRACPDCGRHWLTPVRGTEQDGRVVWCSSCGFVGEVSVEEHTSDHPYVDESTDPPTITDSDVPVSDVIELYEREWTRYEIFDELSIPVEAVQDAIVWHLKEYRDEWREEEEDERGNLAYRIGKSGRDKGHNEWYRARYGTEPVDPAVDEHEDERVDIGYSLLKHENAIQAENKNVRRTGEPGESEVVSEFPHGRIPNGYYELVREALVKQSRATADYFETDPDT